MTDSEGEVARVKDAIDRPTPHLLDRKWAAVAATIWCSFSQDVRAVAPNAFTPRSTRP